jgi:hypothetical protein
LRALFVDGIAERLRPGAKREPVLAAWGYTVEGRRVLLHLMNYEHGAQLGQGESRSPVQTQQNDAGPPFIAYAAFVPVQQTAFLTQLPRLRAAKWKWAYRYHLAGLCRLYVRQFGLAGRGR